MHPIAPLLKHYSTWVMFIVSSAAAYWMQLSPADQAALLASYPAIKLGAPAVSFISFMVAKMTPQGVTPPPPLEPPQ